jgi:hypothetical protein
MDKKSDIQSENAAQLPATLIPLIPAGPDSSDDVARVLEHVSSPFRWELLEISPAQPVSSVADHYHHQKR